MFKKNVCVIFVILATTQNHQTDKTTQPRPKQTGRLMQILKSTAFFSNAFYSKHAFNYMHIILCIVFYALYVMHLFHLCYSIFILFDVFNVMNSMHCILCIVIYKLYHSNLIKNAVELRNSELYYWFDQLDFYSFTNVLRNLLIFFV